MEELLTRLMPLQQETLDQVVVIVIQYNQDVGKIVIILIIVPILLLLHFLLLPQIGEPIFSTQEASLFGKEANLCSQYTQLMQWTKLFHHLTLEVTLLKLVIIRIQVLNVNLEELW